MTPWTVKAIRPAAGEEKVLASLLIDEVRLELQIRLWGLRISQGNRLYLS